jgi:C-terminal processing protease CtpA/Prc
VDRLFYFCVPESSRKLRGNLGMVVRPNGAIILLQPGGPAERAGIAVGDRIVEVNGKSILTTPGPNIPGELSGDPGTTVPILVRRDHRMHYFILVRGPIK